MPTALRPHRANSISPATFQPKIRHMPATAQTAVKAAITTSHAASTTMPSAATTSMAPTPKRIRWAAGPEGAFPPSSAASNCAASSAGAPSFAAISSSLKPSGLFQGKVLLVFAYHVLPIGDVTLLQFILI